MLSRSRTTTLLQISTLNIFTRKRREGERFCLLCVGVPFFFFEEFGVPLIIEKLYGFSVSKQRNQTKLLQINHSRSNHSYIKNPPNNLNLEINGHPKDANITITILILYMSPTSTPFFLVTVSGSRNEASVLPSIGPVKEFFLWIFIKHKSIPC